MCTHWCAHVDVLLRLSTSFLSDRFCWSLCSSLFLLVLMEQYSPHLCGTQPILSAILKRSWFIPSLALLSDAILSILHCFWELSAAFHCSIYSRFISESLSALFAAWQIFVTCSSLQLIGNISGFMTLGLSSPINCSNLLKLSYMWVMACDKQIYHVADRFPFMSSQVIRSCCGNHIKKILFARSYPIVVLEVSSVFPYLRIHSVCGNYVATFNECEHFNFSNCRHGIMLAHRIACAEMKLLLVHRSEKTTKYKLNLFRIKHVLYLMFVISSGCSNERLFWLLMLFSSMEDWTCEARYICWPRLGQHLSGCRFLKVSHLLGALNWFVFLSYSVLHSSTVRSVQCLDILLMLHWVHTKQKPVSLAALCTVSFWLAWCWESILSALRIIKWFWLLCQNRECFGCV